MREDRRTSRAEINTKQCQCQQQVILAVVWTMWIRCGKFLKYMVVHPSRVRVVVHSSRVRVGPEYVWPQSKMITRPVHSRQGGTCVSRIPRFVYGLTFAENILSMTLLHDKFSSYTYKAKVRECRKPPLFFERRKSQETILSKPRPSIVRFAIHRLVTSSNLLLSQE